MINSCLFKEVEATNLGYKGNPSRDYLSQMGEDYTHFLDEFIRKNQRDYDIDSFSFDGSLDYHQPIDDLGNQIMVEYTKGHISKEESIIACRYFRNDFDNSLMAAHSYLIRAEGAECNSKRAKIFLKCAYDFSRRAQDDLENVGKVFPSITHDFTNLQTYRKSFSDLRNFRHLYRDVMEFPSNFKLKRRTDKGIKDAIAEERYEDAAKLKAELYISSKEYAMNV